MRQAPCTIAVLLVSVLTPTIAAPLAGQSGSYDRAIIYLPDNSRFEAADIRLSSTQVSFVRDRNPSTLSLNEVAAIRAYAGTNMAPYALLGAASGAAGVFLGTLNSPQEVLRGKSLTPFYVGYAGVGALVGALVGMTRHKYTEVYAHPGEGKASKVGVRVGLRMGIGREKP